MSIQIRPFQDGMLRRLLALVLSASMVVAVSPPLTAESVIDSAADGGDVTLLSGFAALPEEVRTQTVPLGVTVADLTLPDTLEVYLAEPHFGDEEQSPPDESETEELPPDESEPEELPPDESEPEELPPDESEPEDPQSSSAAESAPDAPPSESREPADDESAGEETQALPDEPAAAEETTGADEPVTQVLSAYVESDRAAEVGGVIWESTPGFDGNITATYIFTPVLPDGYAVEEGVSLPEITVTVEEAVQSALDKLIAMIDALPTPDDALENDEPAQRADIEAAEKLRAALREEERALLPAGKSEKLDALLHILATEYDCLDYDCPVHYSPERMTAVMQQFDPRLLTLDDLVRENGITPPVTKGRSAPNPQTIAAFRDNEDNAHTGKADKIGFRVFTYGGDFTSLNFQDAQAPVEARFDVNSLPTQSAYLVIDAYDVDVSAGEIVQVYFNDVKLGQLRGINLLTVSTVLQVPLHLITPGKNYVTLKLCEEVDAKGKAKFTTWVMPMQLVLDGGKSLQGGNAQIKLDFGEPTNDGMYSSLPIKVELTGNTALRKMEYVVEMRSASDFSYFQTLVHEYNFRDESFSGEWVRSFHKSIAPGYYTAIAMLSEGDPGYPYAIVDIDIATFYIDENKRIVIGPVYESTFSPSAPTNGSVNITSTLKNAMGCTDISIADNGAKTVTENGDYSFAVNYKRAGVARTITHTAKVSNIDKIPPEITFTPFTVPEDTENAEIETLLRGALKTTDNFSFPVSINLNLTPNLAGSIGSKTVAVTATDAAGNQASKNCEINVLPQALTMTQSAPIRVGTSSSFTLSAVLKNAGGDPITETGFVWGSMQNPTTVVYNGKAATAPAVTAKGGAISLTATDIVDGVTYYSRPYAIANGKTYYGEQKTFTIGGKSYGTFSISNSGSNVFTITRADGVDDAQTVYYRTVNGSAVGGTHFTHATGTLTFNQGETVKTVEVAGENVHATFGSNAATAFSNADRTYQMEIYRVVGGGNIAALNNRATRTLTGAKGINASIYTTEVVKDTDRGKWIINDTNANGVPLVTARGGAVNKSFSHQPKAQFTGDTATYLAATEAGYLYRYLLSEVLETDDGWEHTWVGTAPANDVVVSQGNSGEPIPLASTAGTALYTASFELWFKNKFSGFKFPQVGTGKTIPSDGGGVGAPYKNMGAITTVGSEQYIKAGKDDTLYVHFGACGGNADEWELYGINHYVMPIDEREPQIMGVAPMAGGIYKAGDPVIVSIIFDEIVTAAPGVSIETNFGQMNYAGGLGTNVLYFSGQVPGGVTSGVTVSKLNNAASVQDISSTVGTTCTDKSGSASASVDTTLPTITITNTSLTNGTASATINAVNADTLQYAWTNSSTMPVNGWFSCTTGTVAKTRQTDGKWYLHVLGAYGITGSTNYVFAEFNFGTPESPASPLPALTVSANNTSWAHSRDITVTRTPAAAAVTYTGPQSGTATGGTVNVTKNGLYTFTLTSGDETVVTSVSVSKLDAEPPTLALRAPGGTGAVYNTLTFSADAADTLSGVAKVEYAVTATSDVPADGWAVLSSSGSSYNGSYTETAATSKTTKYVHVRATDAAGNITTQTSTAYTVVMENAAVAPAITLTGAPTSWTKGPVNLTWTVTNPGAGDFTVHLDGSNSTDTTGTLSVHSNGLRVVQVADQNGNTAEASLSIQWIDAEAPTLSQLTSSADWDTSKTVTLVGVTDDNTPIADPTTGLTVDYGGSGLKTQEWKLGSGAYTAFTGNSFSVTAAGTYTVRLTDNMGNQNEYETVVSQVDTTAPAVTVGTPAASWTSTAQSIAVTYSDGDSGIGTAQYAITTTNSGTKPTTLLNLPASGSTVSVATDGTSYIYYKVTDKAGNVTDGYSAAIKVDKNIPMFMVGGGVQSAEVLTLNIAPTASASGVTITVSGAENGTIPSGSYSVSKKGTYSFVATTGAGKSTDPVTKKVYGIVFDSKGGSAVNDHLVVSGGKVTKPAAPTKTGFTFAKWQKGGTDFDFATDTITADTTLDAVWALNAPTVSLAVDHATATYDGGATVATLTPTPGHTDSGVTYTYEWYQDGSKLSETGSTLPRTDVAHSGSYTVKVTASAGGLASAQTASNAVAVTINKADVQIDTAPAASGIIYGQALSNSTLTGGAATQKDSSLLRLFRSGTAVPGTFAWTTPATNPAVADSGSTAYGITFTPTDTANYTTATTTTMLTVGKKMLTPSVASAVSREYNGGTDASGTLSLAGAVLGQSPTASGTFAFTAAGVGTNKPVNVTGIALNSTWSDNYTLDNTELTGVSTTAEISPKTIGLTWSGYTGLVYTGNPVNVTATATGLVAPDSCAVTVTGGEQEDAGTHTATAATLDNANYRLPSANTQSYTIAKAPVSFVVSNNTHDYDRTAKTATATQTSGETPDVTGKFTVHYEKNGVSVASPVNVDVYDIVVTLNDNNVKHKDAADETIRSKKVGTLTINGNPYPPFTDGSMTWPTAADLAYGQLLSDSILTGGNQLSNGSYAWETPATRPAVQNEGYLVVFTPNDTNYSPAQMLVPITVTPQTLTVSGATAQDRAYKPGSTTVAVRGGSLSGVISGDDITLDDTLAIGTVTSDRAENGKRVTVSGYTLAGEAKTNYTITQPADLTVNITPAAGTSSVTMTDWIYGDPAGNPVPASATNGTAGVTYSYSGTDAANAIYGPVPAKPTGAGSYTVTATYPATQNYQETKATAAFTVTKRPLELRWSNLYHRYDGQAGTPAATLQNRASADADAQCAIALTGATGNVNAGRYLMTAALTGANTHNYIAPANLKEILVIEPTPVSVSLSDYSHKADGTPKAATVTATPDVAHTVTYRLAGNEVAAPTAPGLYDIMVGLDSPNYRFADGVDGKPRKLGILTIYENKPPQTFTVRFAGGPDATGTPPVLPASVAETIHLLPDNSFTRAGFAFIGWESGDSLYQPQETFAQPANNDTVFTARWKESTYDIGGVVDQDGKPLANVKVVLMRGSEQVAQTVTDQTGRYTFSDVLPGIYNLVASKPFDENGDIVQTIKVVVTTADVDEANITLPSGMTNSVVEVVPGTPKIIVGNLEQTFSAVDDIVYTTEDQQTVKDGGRVEIRFVAEQKEPEQLDETEAKALEETAGDAKIGLYLTLDVQKTVTPPPAQPDGNAITTTVPETSVLLELVIPLPRDLQGKESYSILRMHDGATDTLSTEANSDGEFLSVIEDKTAITLNAKKFSTYAVAYIEKSISHGSGGSDDGAGGGSDGGKSLLPKKPDQTVPTPPTAPVKPTNPDASTAPNKDKADEKTNEKDQAASDATPDTKSDAASGTNPDEKSDTGDVRQPAEDNNDKDRHKDTLREALADAIKRLPDELTGEARQQVIDELTHIADNAIAALDSESDSAALNRIVTEAQTEMNRIVKQAQDAVARTQGKPFVLLSALLVLLALAMVVVCILKKHANKCILLTVAFSVLALLTFLLTSGRSGVAFANAWTLLVAVWAAGAVLIATGRFPLKQITAQKENPDDETL